MARLSPQAPLTRLALVLSDVTEVSGLSEWFNRPLGQEASSRPRGWLALQTLVFDMPQAGRHNKYNYQACKKLWGLQRMQPFQHAIILDSDFMLTQPVPSVEFLAWTHKDVLYATPSREQAKNSTLKSTNLMLGGTNLTAWPLDPPWVIDGVQLERFLAHLANHNLPQKGDRSLASLIRYLLSAKAPTFFEIVVYRLFVLATAPQTYPRTYDEESMRALQKKHKQVYLFDMVLNGSEREELGYYVGRHLHLAAQQQEHQQRPPPPQQQQSEASALVRQCCWMTVHNDRRVPAAWIQRLGAAHGLSPGWEQGKTPAAWIQMLSAAHGLSPGGKHGKTILNQSIRGRSVESSVTDDLALSSKAHKAARQLASGHPDGLENPPGESAPPSSSSSSLSLSWKQQLSASINPEAMAKYAIANALAAANASWCASRPPIVWPRYSAQTVAHQWRSMLKHIYPALLQHGQALDQSRADVYQFGVLDGGSLITLHKEPFSSAHFWAFDTFTGLPESGFDDDASSKVRFWVPGAFSAAGATRSVQQGVAAVHKKLNSSLGATAADLIRFVVGEYSKSLKEPTLARQLGMRPAAYVDIDCDLYASARDALRFMFAARLIVPGTLIGYDDFWTASCAAHYSALAHLSTSDREALRRAEAYRNAHKLNTHHPETLDPAAVHPQIYNPWNVGEWRAHAELAAEFNVSLVCVAGPCVGPAQRYLRCDIHNHIAPIFLVRRVGGRSSSADGVSTALHDDWPWMRHMVSHWPMCTWAGRKHGWK